MAVSVRADKFSLAIGGIGCSIWSRDAAFLGMLRECYRQTAPVSATTYEVLVQLVPLSEFPSGNGRATQPVVKKMNAEGNYLARQSVNPFDAVISTSTRKALVRTCQSRGAFDSFLRVFSTLVLAEEGGLLLHAASISDEGNGKVFFGPSGIGKAMLSRLSKSHTVLTEESSLIRLHNGKYEIYRTPFDNAPVADGDPAHVELKGLYLLREMRENSLVLLDPARAVMELYHSVCLLSDEPELIARVMEICCAVVAKVPVYELHIQPDSNFLEVIDEPG